MATKPITITERHRGALAQVIATFGERRFRRSDLSTRIFGMTSPRDAKRADAISDRLLREAAAAGGIRREGHQHWIKVGKGRILIDGSHVAELPDTKKLTLDTHCPEKWLAVDLETGEVWRGSGSSWKRHPGQHKAAVSSLLIKGTGK